MGNLNVFNFITLNGCYKGPEGDISWHRHGGEEADYSKEGANSGSILLFGRVTYEMMASYWPTSMAAEQFPEVAKGMNSSKKYVISNTLKKAEWNNTQILGSNFTSEIKQLKESGRDITILGSGSIVSQCADAGLIDTLQIMLDPVVLAKGTPIFQNTNQNLNLELTGSKTFSSGVVLLSYKFIR